MLVYVVFDETHGEGAEVDKVFLLQEDAKVYVERDYGLSIPEWFTDKNGDIYIDNGWGDKTTVVAKPVIQPTWETDDE